MQNATRCNPKSYLDIDQQKREEEEDHQTMEKISGEGNEGSRVYMGTGAEMATGQAAVAFEGHLHVHNK